MLDEYLKELGAFFHGYDSAYQKQYEQWKKTAQRFNIFEAINIVRAELKHSAMLAYLLNPDAHHDQGARFLDSFLKMLRIDPPPGSNLKSTRVITEYPVDVNDGGRNDNDRGRRLDIVLFLLDRRIIVVENKVDASEGDGQIPDYQRWLHKEGCSAGVSNLLVFLTPDGHAPEEDVPNTVQVRLLSYKKLGYWLQEFTNSDLPDRLRHVLCMYKDICLTIGGVTYESQ